MVRHSDGKGGFRSRASSVGVLGGVGGLLLFRFSVWEVHWVHSHDSVLSCFVDWNGPLVSNSTFIS